ncbi:MAG TPA: hypothetical protein VKP89_12900 [Burkholderiales bacterium]|nr:hypothetical protein [Burkholderiales bacterium]
MFRFFRSKKRSAKAVAPPRDPEAYSDALLSGWVLPPEAFEPSAPRESVPGEKQDSEVLERFYRSQQ